MDDTNRPARDHTAPDRAPWHGKFEIDPSVPHAARVYDYVLGGSEWFSADREFAEKLLTIAPFVAPYAQANKAFLSRVVRFLSEEGVRQFIDIGCGLPYKDLVHDIAWQVSPWAKTLYVDYDALVIKRMDEVIDTIDPEHKRLSVMQADIREIDVILESEETETLFDFSEPVGLLALSILPFLGPNDDAAGLLARYRDALPAGSFFAASHGTRENIPNSVLEQGNNLERFYASSTNPVYYRTRSEFRELFDGWDLVDPGVVWAPEWHPESANTIAGPETSLLVGVGKK